jgi:hypothetical protein
MRGEILQMLMGLAGITTNAFINFVAPLILYWTVLGLYDEAGKYSANAHAASGSQWPPAGLQVDEEESDDASSFGIGGDASGGSMEVSTAGGRKVNGRKVNGRVDAATSVVPGQGVIHPLALFLPVEVLPLIRAEDLVDGMVDGMPTTTNSAVGEAAAAAATSTFGTGGAPTNTDEWAANRRNSQNKDACCTEVCLGRSIALGLGVLIVPVFVFALVSTVHRLLSEGS